MAYSIIDNLTPTSNIMTAERDALRKSIAKTVSKYGSAVKTIVDGKPKVAYNGAIRQDKRADIVIGLPASGKSSVLVDPLSEKYKARVIDSDMVKELLPEFDNGYGAGVVHEESKGIATDWLRGAVAYGDNVVYQIVGSNVTSVLEKVEYLKQNGYTVNLHLNEVSNEKATGRMLKRFFTDNRFIDPKLMAKYGDKLTQVYNELKELEGYIDGYSKYSNDVEFGKEPKLIERSEIIPNDRRDAGRRHRHKMFVEGNKGTKSSGASGSGASGSEQPNNTTEIKDTPSGVSSFG